MKAIAHTKIDKNEAQADRKDEYIGDPRMRDWEKALKAGHFDPRGNIGMMWSYDIGKKKGEEADNLRKEYKN